MTEETRSYLIDPDHEVAVDSPSDPKLTVILPREVYDRLVRLAQERAIARGELPSQHTNAISGEQHPLHNTGRGVK